ncbi:MAG: hypothetical protein ACRYHA_10005 [Janthinobacterium lividum]
MQIVSASTPAATPTTPHQPAPRPPTATAESASASSAKVSLSDAAKASQDTVTSGKAAPASTKSGDKADAKADAKEESKTAGSATASKDADTAHKTDGKDGAKAEGKDEAGHAEAAKHEPASPLKSLVSGALGLQSPEDAAKNTDSYYSIGKWIAAAATIGGIVSIFI